MNLAETIVYFVDIAFEVYIFILFARVIFSWIRVNPYGKLFQFVFSLTEPLLAPIRNLMPKGTGLDFSPMILMFILIFLQRICVVMVASLF